MGSLIKEAIQYATKFGDYKMAADLRKRHKKSTAILAVRKETF
jgi:hypothetical protein